ncbi:MAG: HAD family hydrolase [Segetibacter sp.]
MTAIRKAIFLDKDGTLIPDIPYNVNPDLITLQNGVIEGLKLLKENEYIFVIISNQAGVARGYFEYNELEKVKEKLNFLLNKEGIEIEEYYFCPHHPLGKLIEYSIVCNCRKPEPGMILKAAKELEIDTEKSWMIGDILNDVEAGNKAGCKTVLLDLGNETEWIEGSFRKPTFVAPDFLQAARFICNNPNDKNLEEAR